MGIYYLTGYITIELLKRGYTMPYTRRDYPVTMKNLDLPVRDKAIDIVNAMIEDGYDEGDAIPIAIAQAKEWANNASDSELATIRKKDLNDHEPIEGKSGARLADSDVIVSYNYDEEKWQVKSKGADQVEGYYDTKKEATDRAGEIAQNRESEVMTKTKEESK